MYIYCIHARVRSDTDWLLRRRRVHETGNERLRKNKINTLHFYHVRITGVQIIIYWYRYVRTRVENIGWTKSSVEESFKTSTLLVYMILI